MIKSMLSNDPTKANPLVIAFKHLQILQKRRRQREILCHREVDSELVRWTTQETILVRLGPCLLGTANKTLQKINLNRQREIMF